ncbi:MAG: hypothetical protein AB8G95_04340 [Anaerolineae bacterium]
MQQTATWYEERKHRTAHNFIEKIWNTSPLLTAVTIGYVLLVGFCLIGLVIDGRTVLGEPVWIKPLKFAISSVVYCGTIAWMMTYVVNRRWVGRTIAGASAFFMVIEIACVVIQASRGVRSHFNFSTDLDAAIFGVMGLMITALWAVNFILIIVLMFQPFKDFAFKTSLILGMIVALIGGAIAMPMLNQTTAAQQAIEDSGERSSFQGGHTLGAEDGGEGLPFVGWSTTHGDLRPAHFLGLHGLQLIPLLGMFINRRWSQFTVGRRTFMVFIGAMAYLGIMYALFQQAMNQLPITSFDTVTTLILILVTVSYGTLWNMAIKGGRTQTGQLAESYR